MMLPFYTLDVFTDQPFAGNPLAVVLEADGLSTAQMQTIAREFNLSETTFVRKPVDPAHTAEVRIFFPTAEIAFAGHPTIGCALLLAQLAALAGDAVSHIVLEEQAGLVPVSLTSEGGTRQATLTAPVIPYPRPCEIDAALRARAVDLAPADIGFASHTCGVFAGGPAFLYVPLQDTKALAQARPIEPFWSQMMEAAGVDSAYLYTPGEGADFQARMFSPTAGIPEDPATGSASAILAGAFLAAGTLSEGTTTFALRQGVEMGRPSRIGLAVDVLAGQITAVRVTGTMVRISEGRIMVPTP